jgi:ATP-binding cassette subfamily F protein uup
LIFISINSQNLFHFLSVDFRIKHTTKLAFHHFVVSLPYILIQGTMNYLNAEHISKSYGDKTLFSDISLLINKGDKVALVAKNGTGKSTFLRVLGGLEAAEGEAARIIVRDDIRTVFLHQEPEFNPTDTILDAVFDVDNPRVKAIREYESALLTQDENRLKMASARLDDLKAWEMEVMIKETLGKLKVDAFAKPVSQLSGGQRKRLALARVLIQEPDFLILDEPTNHLDLDMIEWLEGYLSQSKLTLLMVTHDRYFLENVCNRIVELEDGILYNYSGNYERYLEKKISRTQNEAVVADKNRKLLKKEWEWLNRQPKARGTKAKARVGKTYELKEKVANIKKEEEMSIHIESRRLGGKIVEFHDVSKAFDEIRILDHFLYKFTKNEKVGIVGANGAGKTTMINLMTGNLKPDSGKIVIGETVVFGYFTQDGLQLSEDKRVIEVIRDVAEYLPMPKGQKLSAEQLLERFLFPRKQQQVYVSQLSGGEKRRLHLLRVLMNNPNFLILDEPTNDLDILTLNVLEDYLTQFKGCLVIVTHDRYFMDKLVDHLFIMDGNGNIRDYNGNYSRLRAEERMLFPGNGGEKTVETAKEKEKVDQEALRKAKKKIKNELNRVERELEKMEDKKKALSALFEKQEMSPEEITQKSKEIQQITQQITELEERWEELVEELDA